MGLTPGTATIGAADAGASSGPGDDNPSGRLGILFFTVLVDLVGFGIVLPLLPFYAQDFGATGLQVGFLVTIYSLVQLFMAPMWGRISDRIGRKPVLIVGLVGSGIAYLIFARADSLAVLFLSRIVGGVGGSTIPVAQAYIADIHAGTFAQLVQAAERCPAGIIHPGDPVNPKEKDLKKWIARAEPFN